ncbi:SusC/RagA family TonB-linked outer membrane protein [Alistipes sp. OttesenSCG-928-B03]|nr:SusC/RagA family TonB-linked outer membrane protein [Alistipes sp. OttesenSCG-928-B03]
MKNFNYDHFPSGKWRKILFFMRLKLVVLLCSVGALAASPSFSQQKKLDVSYNRVPLASMLNDIKARTGYQFLYYEEVIPAEATVTIRRANASVEEILNEVLPKNGLSYTMHDEVIVISISEPNAAQQPQTRPVTISGTVRDSDGRPIAGATIILKNSPMTGTATDGTGRFSLRTTDPANTVLVVSFIGKKTIEYTFPNQGEVTITLEDDIATIDNIVVTGIFERSRESYTGSVSEISQKELQLFRGQNLVATLANIDPSVNLVISNEFGSDPNRLPEMNLRGSASLPKTLQELNEGMSAQLNTPLIIMDGFSISLQKLMDFNEEDVQSITILKDASATAIYGSRGANGVIVITTKRPAEGNLRVQFQAGMNIEMPDLTSYNLMNSREKLRLEYTAGFYDADDPLRDIQLKELYTQRLTDIGRGVDTYWLSQPLRTSVGQRYGLQLTWGTERFQIGTNISYNNIEGVMKGSERRVFSGNVTLQYNYKSLTFRNQTAVDINKAIQSPYGTFSDYAKLNPYWRIHDDDGKLVPGFSNINIGWEGTNIYEEGNPLYNATLNTINESRYTNVINNFSVEWKIIDGLNLRGNLGLMKQFNSSDHYLPAEHTSFNTNAYSGADGFFRKGKYTYGTGENTEISGNVTLNFSRTFADRHQIDAGLDLSLLSNESFSYEIVAEGYGSDENGFLPNALQFAQGVRPTGSESISRSVGFTGFAVYSFDNRYFVDLSYRIDGSSLFGSKNKFAPFWSAGVGWNIHNEKFFKGNDIVNRLKLRASIGETGSQQFSAYQSLATYQYFSAQRYLSWRGAELMALSNDELKWQTTVQANLGLEFQLYDGRISGSFDYYVKTTKDLLSNMDIPLAHGFSSYVANIGEVENRGFEAGLSGYLIRDTKRNIVWTVTGKIAYNKNKILKLSDAIKAQYESYMAESANLKFLEEGRSLNAIYAVRSQGIDPSTGNEIYVGRDGLLKSSWSASDRVYCGVSDPKYRGNVSTYFAYKNLSLNLSFAYHWGGQQYNSTLMEKVEVKYSDIASGNVDKRVYTDRWLNWGDVKPFKGLMNNSANYATSRFVMDDNVFQLQSASVTYRWESPFIKEKLKLGTVNFTANMSDIFYVSTIKRERGTSYPFSRKCALNVTITF